MREICNIEYGINILQVKYHCFAQCIYKIEKNQIILHGKEELPYNTTQLMNEDTLQCFQSKVIDVSIKLIDWRE